MTKLGFSGGGYIKRLGNAYDLSLFFSLINTHCKFLNNKDKELIDKLRVRYITSFDLNAFIKLLPKIDQELKSITVLSTISEIRVSESTLNWDKDTLADVFKPFFDGLHKVCESFKFYINDWGEEPQILIRTLITDVPLYDWFDNISLEYYDSLDLEGDPLWIKPISTIKEIFDANRIRQ